MIRIAVCVATDHTGGAERYLTRLHRELANAGKAESHLFGRVPGWAEAGLDSTAVDVGPKWSAKQAARALRTSRSERAAFVLAVEREHRTRPFDVIHMQFKREQILLSKSLASLAPVVWTEHAPLPSGRKGRALAPLYRRSSGSVDTIIGVSDWTRDSVAQAVKPSVHSIAISSAVDTRRFRPPDNQERATARNQYCDEADKVLAVSICRLSPLKRVERTLDALDGASGFELLIAGDGPSRSDLERRAQGRPVEFLGWVEDPVELYWAADIAFINAEPQEGLLLSLLEAAASGCAIVGFEGSPVDGAIRDAGGVLLSPGSKIDLEDIIATLESRQIAARIWAEQHDYATWVSAHLTAFEAAASRSAVT